MDIQFGNPNAIYLIVLAILALGLAIFAAYRRRRAATRFATENLRPLLMPPLTSWHYWASAVLVSITMALLAVALMDIRWGKTKQEVPQKGIEVIFVLDVSRSMLAEDVTPNRLRRAKQQIKDMVNEMSGDRIGLVVFAGDARQSVPLTSHYEDFKQVLDGVGPHSVRRGGSRLGDALAVAGSGFISKTNDHKAIVVFTDGEDQESDPIGVAKKLHQEHGIRVFTVGLGDMQRGAPIPETETRQRRYVEYGGQRVLSKMNGQILSQIATETNGAYIPAGTKRVDAAAIYHGYIAKVDQMEFETATINAYVARFQWFAGPALFLLLVETWIAGSRSKRSKRKSVTTTDVPETLAAEHTWSNAA